MLQFGNSLPSAHNLFVSIMIVKPKIRGFVCITAHPVGCAAHVQEQINYVKEQGTIAQGPKNVLVIGASTGYGLATRIAAAFGSKANTLGICFERPFVNDKPASAGWYNCVAFEEAAHNAGLFAQTLNGDAFSHQMKADAIAAIKASMGKIDLVVYSLAAPKRVDADTGEAYRSVLKPVGEPFVSKNLDTDKKHITQVTLEPATQEEIDATIKVMGGEDWQSWMDALAQADVLAPNVQTLAYSYIGPEVTWPIYKNGTIGQAKKDVERAAKAITENLKPYNGRALVAVNKAVVTQASSAIPVVPLYISLLFKVMKAKGTHEDCIEQMYRMLATQVYASTGPQLDEAGRIRMDDYEMADDVQKKVFELWPKVTNENIDTLSDFSGYQANFLKLFGFGIEGIDYEQDVQIDLAMQTPAILS